MQVPVDVDTLKQINSYVAATQPVLLKAAETQRRLPELAEKAADTLVRQGFLNAGLRTRKVAAYIENPLQALVDLHTVAAVAAPPSLGGPAGQDKSAELHADPANESSDDAFARQVMAGRPGQSLAS